MVIRLAIVCSLVMCFCYGWLLCLYVVHLAESDTYQQEEWKAAEELRITDGINFKEELVAQPTKGDGDKVRRNNYGVLTYDNVYDDENE